MLISKKKKAFASHHSLLCAATKVVGNIYFSGDFYLEGTLKGNIYTEEGKPARLIVTETGVVEGEIHASNAIINGRVYGTIYSTKHLELAAKAVIEGSIYYQSIEMVKGAQLIGQMHSTVKQQALGKDAKVEIIPHSMVNS
ncbi:MAG: polymer-forming cytoskeletal protein [Moraxellaceae bacterium]|nr:MAG: polymer-forming cytoskeletal protein [Moraxellaceae bacterium]